MGKAKAKRGSTKATKTPLVAAVPAETTPQDWTQTLTAEEQEAEKKRREARETKAAEAKRREEQDRFKREQWDKAQKSASLRAAREEKKIEREFQQCIAQATRDGVLTAVLHVDGAYYVEVAKNTWKSTEYDYYCPHCDAHLSNHALGSHLAGGNHQRKMAWLVAPDVAETASRAAVPSPPAPHAAAAGLESWQEVCGDYIRCIPCGKRCDGNHETTDDHKRRVANWISQATAEYREPPQPWLAWVADPKWPDEPALKCLLCDKWVQDCEKPHEPACVATYSGSHGNPGPSNQKDHARKIQDLKKYPELRTEKARWHPPTVAEAVPAVQPRAEDDDGWQTVAQRGLVQATAAEPPLPPELPLPEKWRACWSPSRQECYYSHVETRDTTWDPPPLPAAAIATPPVVDPGSVVELFEC